MPLPQFAAHALRAACELALARLFLHRTQPPEVLRRNAQSARAASMRKSAEPDAGAQARCDRVIAFIAAMALRVPWRADCLVQAMAAQRWLARKGLASEIVVGAAKHPDGSFEAHAWLVRGGAVILGGDVARFEPLLDSSTAASRRR